MKILQLCNKIPYPLRDGGSIATFNLTRSFKKLGHEVTILAMNTSRHYFDVNKVPEEVSQIARIVPVKVNTNIQLIPALLNLIQNRSYNVSRFISMEYELKLIELLKTEKFDVIQLEGLYLTPYAQIIRKHTNALISMRAHNIEHEIWERIAIQESNPLKKTYLKFLAGQLKVYEITHLNDYDCIIPITDRDNENLKKLGCKIPSHTCPVGIDTQALQPDHSNMEYPSVFFIGALDWIPNQEGLKWFIEKVWPSVHKEFPEVTFYIAGRKTPEWVFRLEGNGIKVLGEVDDAYEFMRSKAVMVVPLFSGSGMRVKIIEGMALGKTIVSTEIGAEGIEIKNRESLIIADNAEEFIAAIIKYLRDPNLFQHIGKNAENIAVIKFDNHVISSELLNFYSRLIEKV